MKSSVEKSIQTRGLSVHEFLFFEGAYSVKQYKTSSSLLLSFTHDIILSSLTSLNKSFGLIDHNTNIKL